VSCHKCGFCQADVTALENISVDARSRGNYRIATLLDRALERCDVLRENLQPNNREYLKNVSRMVREHPSSHECANLLRDAKQVVETDKGRQQPTQRETGFLYMAQYARAGSTTLTPEETVQCALDEIEADERQSSTPIKRGMGFGNMFEVSRRGTFEGDEEFKPQPETRSGYGFRAMLDGASRGNATGESVETRDDVKPIPCGLAAMLEAMSPAKTRAPLDEKPHVRRGMGFANMLEGARRGTE
jgi:hypothetical protein